MLKSLISVRLQMALQCFLSTVWLYVDLLCFLFILSGKDFIDTNEGVYTNFNNNKTYYTTIMQWKVIHAQTGISLIEKLLWLHFSVSQIYYFRILSNELENITICSLGGEKLSPLGFYLPLWCHLVSPS